MIVCHRVGDVDKFPYENYGLGIPRFLAMVI